ncbi:sel1 repeat family protein, partial [Burkholderia latens]
MQPIRPIRPADAGFAAAVRRLLRAKLSPAALLAAAAVTVAAAAAAT